MTIAASKIFSRVLNAQFILHTDEQTHCDCAAMVNHGTVVMVMPAGTGFESMNSVIAAAEL